MSDPVPTGSVKGRAPEGWEDELNAAWALVNSLRAEVEGLRVLIGRAPHARHCEAGASFFPGRCNCWKADVALAGSPLVSGEPGQAKGSE